MECTVLTTRKPTARSKITNGGSLFSDELIDGRSAMSRRFRDILSAIVSDLGGSDRLSEGQRQLARRCALLAVESEKLEAKSVAGEEIDIDRFGMMTDRLGRALQRLGLKRVAKEIVPDLRRYIEAKR
jgi:hypothetical protein